jgi:subtilase family serine protease
MSRNLSRIGTAVASVLLLLFASGGAQPAAALVALPDYVEAPDTGSVPAGGSPACTSPAPVHTYAHSHCYTPSDIAAAYGLDKFRAAHPGDPHALGAGRTIVLVDSYGSPTAANDIKFFHDAFYPGLPAPSFDEVYPNGQLTYDNTATGNGQSGPSAAASWSFEATLDIEWAYAIAPLAHIVLLATNPAETLGVQGMPNMFKAIRDAIDTYPAGTVFSQSFGLAEQTFGGAAAVQTAGFDQVYQHGISKGDTFVASSGDEGSGGADKTHRDSGTFSFPVVGYPASSPYNLAVGGTQLMYNWLWAPTNSDPTTCVSAPRSPACAAFLASSPAAGVAAEPVWQEAWLGPGNNTSAGGKSTLYASPSWQGAQASLTGGRRGIPDLSWSAAVNGGVLVYITAFPNAIRPGWHITGGTSAASPQVAGLLAVVNSMRAEAGRAPIGDPHAAVYALGNGSSPSTYYRDVTPQHFGTVGYPLVDNRWITNTPNVPGYPVTAGWDMTTGFGSPLANAWIPALVAS